MPAGTQRFIPSSPWYRLRSRPCRRLTTLMRPSHPVRHFWPLRNQRFFCSRLRVALLVDRLGMQTRLTQLSAMNSCHAKTAASVMVALPAPPGMSGGRLGLIAIHCAAASLITAPEPSRCTDPGRGYPRHKNELAGFKTGFHGVPLQLSRFGHFTPSGCLDFRSLQ